MAKAMLKNHKATEKRPYVKPAIKEYKPVVEAVVMAGKSSNSCRTHCT